MICSLASQTLKQTDHEPLVQHRLPAQNALHSDDQFALGYIFERITRSTCFEGLEEVLRIFVYGYENHASSLTLLLDGTARSKTIQLRHVYGHQRSPILPV